jgi:adenine-specific DNA methylase
MIEKNFDISFIAALALREKQIQQNYRPIIAVHKWFARRPGTLFRGVMLSEFGNKPVSETFFQPNDFPQVTIADPFMGGGTPLLEANRLGCDVVGFDINPMAAWIVQEEIEHIDLVKYRSLANDLMAKLTQVIGEFFLTDCPLYGERDVPVKYFLWVKVLDCEACGEKIDLFPGYLLAENRRHPANVVVCWVCGDLNEIENIASPGQCKRCQSHLKIDGPAKRNRCACARCGHMNRYPGKYSEPLKHRLFAIEYYNPFQKANHKGRFFKKPDQKDLDRIETARCRWLSTDPRFVPNEAILPGDETDRLHRWNYSHYRELFNERQLLSLETSCRLISEIRDERIRHALSTNLSDLLRYQNMLCRYDTMALKSLDIFAIHGFPVSLVQCESNFLGIPNGNGASVGSGGWSNIIEKYVKAKKYCDDPFEVRRDGSKKILVPIEGEWIGEHREGLRSRRVEIHCNSSTGAELVSGSLDAVFTDPPYFGNVQYGELMDFCYVWLRKLVGTKSEGFDRKSTRSIYELTGNKTESRGIENFTEGLSDVYSRMARALRSGAPLVFTYHHNLLEAYHAIGVAILDSGLVCSASLPCPAEMGGSIHIHGTDSSIVDTVFVCRDPDIAIIQNPFSSLSELSDIVKTELGRLRLAGMKPTEGDIRCIVYGHLTRMSVWNLHPSWNNKNSTSEKLSIFAKMIDGFGKIQGIIDDLAGNEVDEAKQLSLQTNKKVKNAVSF